MNEYKQYPIGTKVKIKETGEIGEAFESGFDYVSIFIDGEKRCRYFKIEDVEFINN